MKNEIYFWTQKSLVWIFAATLLRLVAEATGKSEDTWPKEIQKVELAPADASLSPEEKVEKAREEPPPFFLTCT